MSDFTRTTLPLEQIRWLSELRMPGRIDAEQTAKLLGMMSHDIPILVSAGLLQPLGNPVQNSTKWFCAVEMIQLAADRDWLHKATKKLGSHWKEKRARKSSELIAP